MSTTTENPIITTNKPGIGEFGSGKYSPLMGECYKDAKIIFRLTDTQADKLARQIGSDYGAAMREVNVEANISRKATKDGKVTLSETGKLKGVTITYPLAAMQALKYANECGQFGFLRGKTQWAMSTDANTLGDYLAKL